MSEADFPVDIFIRKIHSSGICRMAVDHEDLSVIAVILAFTLVCLLTGNINPVCRVTAMLMPVWLAAELRLLCTLL